MIFFYLESMNILWVMTLWLCETLLTIQTHFPRRRATHTLRLRVLVSALKRRGICVV
jgi:hypothetical protein